MRNVSVPNAGKYAVMGSVVTLLMLMASFVPRASGRAQEEGDSRIERGFAISPVPLNLNGKNRALVGLGSYFVNAIGDCTACHTQPRFRFEPGGNPFRGQTEVNRTDHYLSGGRIFFSPPPFPPGIPPFDGAPEPPDSATQVVSRNITPFEDGLPAGLNFEEFLTVMRTGNDYDIGLPGANHSRLLQIMPWPVFRNLTDRDILAIYEYLTAIPPLPPPTPE